jgi:hypothetical protein
MLSLSSTQNFAKSPSPLLQPSAIAPAIRIRENQRRARARRKELIGDLKSRVRDYELQGVAATAEIQEAGRKALLENKRLRALLAKKGVPTAEVEAFLNGHDYETSVNAPFPTPKPVDVIGTQSEGAPPVDLRLQAAMHASDAVSQPVSAAPSSATLMCTRLENAKHVGKNSQYTRSSNDNELCRPGEQLEKYLERRIPSPNFLEPVSDCYCPELEPVPDQVQSPETECSIAANILAGFRGHGDVERARAELGCPDSTQCSITNTALLHALDSEHTSGTQTYNAYTTTMR